jgi:hypothetical protein
MWGGGSVVFTPVVGYFLGVLAKNQTVELESTVVPFRPKSAMQVRPQAAAKDRPSRWRALGA